MAVQLELVGRDFQPLSFQVLTPVHSENLIRRLNSYS